MTRLDEDEAATGKGVDRRVLIELAARRRGLSNQLLNPSDADRFSATIEAIPGGTISVLDAACGLGVLTDVLLSLGYKARGIDLDPEAMVEMMAPHDVGSIGSMPYPDRSFEAVIANEVLEHLPVDVFEQARVELARVAKRHVIVTVPNAEALESASTRCPACTSTYSIHGHVRRFGRDDMDRLLPGLRLTYLGTVGPYKLRHRSVEWWIRRRALGRWPRQPGAICPQCGWVQEGQRTSTEAGAGSPYGSRLLRAALGVPWQRWWFLARYDRHD